MQKESKYIVWRIMSLLTIFKKEKLPTDWRWERIGNVLLESQYGTNEPSVEKGNTAVVGMKDIQNGKVLTENLSSANLTSTDKKKYLLNKGDILINRTNSFDLVGKVGIYDSESEATFASYLVRLVIDDKKVEDRYLNYWLNSATAQGVIKRIATKAVSQANVNPTEFKKFCFIPLPPLPEQKAIADTLSVWDEAIEKTERLVAAKERMFKGLLHSQVNKKVKKNNRKKVKLKDICEPVTRKNDVGETNVLTSSAKNGLVSQLDYYKKSVSSENLTNYYLLKKGDFAYNRSSANGYPYGATKRLDHLDQAVLSTLYLCFSIKPNVECKSDFLLYLFESGSLNKELRAVCQEGARSHGLLNITKTDFFNMVLYLPTLKDQKQIADILNTAQSEINLLKTLAEKYKEQKRGLMQKLLTGEWRVNVNIEDKRK